MSKIKTLLIEKMNMDMCEQEKKIDTTVSMVSEIIREILRKIQRIPVEKQEATLLKFFQTLGKQTDIKAFAETMTWLWIDITQEIDKNNEIEKADMEDLYEDWDM